MKKILLSERIFIAGSTGMAGSAIYRSLKNAGYGQKDYGGVFLTPKRDELDLLNRSKVFDWFCKNKPSVVVIAAAKVIKLGKSIAFVEGILLDSNGDLIAKGTSTNKLVPMPKQ